MTKLKRSFMLISRLAICFVFYLLVATSTSFAAKPTDASQELIALLDNIHTMRAKFEQVGLSKGRGKAEQKTIGLMQLERPGKFRWEITSPSKQTIVLANNKTLWYDADLEQLVKRKVNYMSSTSPAMLLSSSSASIINTFKISKTEEARGNIWFILEPKSTGEQKADFRSLKLHFVAGKIQAMQIADNLDQVSQINFSDVVVNAKLSPKTFVFVPPKNTDVIEED